MTTKAKTTTRRTTTVRKTTATRKTAPAIDVEETQAVVAEAPQVDLDVASDDAVQVEEIPVVPMPEMKKKELVDLAVERSGVKKRDAKPAIEAALAVLGEALAEGRELNLMPFGKLKVTRMKKGGNGQIINARVRQPEESDFSDEMALAQAAE